MDEGAVSPERLGKVVPLRVAAQPPPPLEQLVEQTFRIAIGMTALASEVLAEAVARTLGREPFAEGEAPGDETARPASGVPLVAGAAIGVALEGAKWGARAATTMVRSAELFFSLVTSPEFVQEPLRQAGTRLGTLDARWREQRPRDDCRYECAYIYDWFSHDRHMPLFVDIAARIRTRRQNYGRRVAPSAVNRLAIKVVSAMATMHSPERGR